MIRRHMMSRICAGILLASFFAPLAQGAPEDELAFPPAYDAEAVDNLRSLLGYGPEYVLGLEPIIHKSVRQEGSTIVVELTTTSGEILIEQETSGTVSGGRTYRVPTPALTPGFELDIPSGGVTFAGPIGAFQEGRLESRAESLARALGIPAGDEDHWTVTPLETTPGPRMPFQLIHDVMSPYGFVLDCPTCSVAVRHPPDFTGALNVALAVFDEDGTWVAFHASRWINVDDPRFLDAPQAQQRLRQELEDEGYEVREMEFSATGFEPREHGVVYHWNVILSDDRLAWVTQDADDGQLVESPRFPSGHSAGASIPLPPAVAALALTLAAVLVRRR